MKLKEPLVQAAAIITASLLKKEKNADPLLYRIEKVEPVFQLIYARLYRAASKIEELEGKEQKQSYFQSLEQLVDNNFEQKESS